MSSFGHGSYRGRLMRILDEHRLEMDLDLDLGFGVHIRVRAALVGLDCTRNDAGMPSHASAFLRAWNQLLDGEWPLRVFTLGAAPDRHGVWLVEIAADAQRADDRAVTVNEALLQAGMAVQAGRP